MNDVTPEQCYCKVCGDPIRSDNTFGICGDKSKPACAKARRRVARERKPPKPHQAPPRQDPRQCEICGRPLNRTNASGLCSGRQSPPCWAERHRRLMRGERQQVKPPYITAGTVFGRLTALEDAPHASSDVRCICIDGTEVTPKGFSLVNGKTRSCGCLRREIMSTNGGFSKHPLYKTWRGMINRCTNPNSDSYPNYGGRGITVCERWLDSPWLFAEDVEREIGLRPEGTYESGLALYSFDRINVDLGYGPGNVKWSDQGEQLRNRRKVGALTSERDALAAQVEMLTARLRELGE